MLRRGKLTWIRSVRVTAVALVLMGSPAYAGSFYWEIGGGLSKVTGAPSLFPGSTISVPSSLGFGLAMNLTVAVDVSPTYSPVAIQLGVQDRYSTTTSAAGAFGLQASYPVVRIQAERFFLTLGATPFVWHRAESTAGFSGFTRSSGTILMLGEAGYLFPITPSVYFGVAGAGQFVDSGGSFSKSPALEGTAFLRFNYGKLKRGLSSTDDEADSVWDPSDYPGWRYPYGREFGD